MPRIDWTDAPQLRIFAPNSCNVLKWPKYSHRYPYSWKRQFKAGMNLQSAHIMHMFIGPDATTYFRRVKGSFKAYVSATADAQSASSNWVSSISSSLQVVHTIKQTNTVSVKGGAVSCFCECHHNVQQVCPTWSVACINSESTGNIWTNPQALNLRWKLRGLWNQRNHAESPRGWSLTHFNKHCH